MSINFWTLKQCLNNRFKKIWLPALFFSLLHIFTFSLQAQVLNFNLSHEFTQTGDTVAVVLTTDNFEDIVSFQFSINWDVDVIEYLYHETGVLDNVAVGEFEIADGVLRLSWFDLVGDGVSIDGNVVIETFYFLATGPSGSFTNVDITGSPLEVQIFQGTGAVNNEIPINQENGSVTIGENNTFIANVNPVNCFDGNDGAIITTFSNGVNYSWTGPNAFTSSEPSIFNLEPGDYNLIVQDAMSNVLIDTSFIIVSPLSALEITDLSVTESDCNDPTGTVDITAFGGTGFYSYDIGTGPNTLSNFSALPPGNYTVTVTDENDCQVTSDFSIASNSITGLELGDDVSFCAGETYEINAGDFVEYTWSTGETGASITVNQTGAYIVSITDQFDCLDSDTINVEFLTNAAINIANDSLVVCPGDSLELLISGATEYFWIDDTNTLTATDIPNPIATPSETTVYTLIASNICSELSEDIEVTVLNSQADAGETVCVAPGNVAQLNATGGSNYEWEASPYALSNYEIPNPTVEPETSAFFFIQIEDENNCIIRDSVQIIVADDPAEIIIAVNTITPNGDGKNDVLEFQNIEKYTANAIRIYNRWGDIVYSRINYQNDEERFDGTRKGKALPAGTYYYILSFTGSEIKQTLTIIRE